LLSMIDDLNESDLDQKGFGLEAKIRSLHLDRERIGPLYMVNCNRSELADLFWDRFDEKEDENALLQFYFIPAAPLQMPPSFAERMILEIIDDMDEDGDAINVERRSDGLRLKIANFEVKNNLRRTQRAFEKYFCKRFQATDFQQLLQHHLAKLEYEYIASIFKIELREWKPFMPEFLQWAIDHFRAMPNENETKFLFFIVINMDDFVDTPMTEDQKRILAEIRSVLGKNEAVCTKLKGLAPVPEDDLESWFRDTGEQNPNKIDDVIQTVVASLSPEEQAAYQQNERLDMAVIEELQKKVYEIANE
ncbi:MAG: hypothetical protein AAFO82_17970, partial [Bacteroidota bacterium]